MKKLMVLVVAVMIMAMAGAAMAATATTPVQVSADIVGACSIATLQDMAFGTIAPSGGPYNATANITLNCTAGLSAPVEYNIVIDNGLHNNLGKNISNGTSAIPYTADFSAALPDTTGVPQTIQIDGVIVLVPVASTEGAYSDTLTLTLNY